MAAGVPYVLVNGVVLSETTDLLSKVCKAYAGPELLHPVCF